MGWWNVRMQAPCIPMCSNVSLWHRFDFMSTPHGMMTIRPQCTRRLWGGWMCTMGVGMMHLTLLLGSRRMRWDNVITVHVFNPVLWLVLMALLMKTMTRDITYSASVVSIEGGAYWSNCRGLHGHGWDLVLCRRWRGNVYLLSCAQWMAGLICMNDGHWEG